jgi:hypothetical protein
LIKKTRHLWKFLDCDEKKKTISELEATMSSPSFWDDQTEAKRVSSEANRLKQTVEKIESFRTQVDDLEALAELCDEDENDQEMEGEFISTLETLLGNVEDLEVASFLGEPFDDRPCTAKHTCRGWRNRILRLGRYVDENVYAMGRTTRDLRLNCKIFNQEKRQELVDALFEWKVYMLTDTQRLNVESIDWFELVLLTRIKEGTHPFVLLM